MNGAEDVFSSKKGGKTEEEGEKDKLLRTIRELKVENDFLKKGLAVKPLSEKRYHVKNDSKPRIRKQCKILNIHRSSYYYKAKTEMELNLELM